MVVTTRERRSFPVGIADKVADADVDDTGRGHDPHIAVVIEVRARRSSPVGIVDTVAAVEVDTARRGHIPHIVAVVVRVRDRRS